MIDIHFRVPDDVNSKLKTIASKKGISKNELMKRVLSDYVANPDMKNIEDKYVNLVKDVVAIYSTEIEKNREQLEDNYYLLRQIMSKMK